LSQRACIGISHLEKTQQKRSGNTACIERLDRLRFFAAALVLPFHAWLWLGSETQNLQQFPIINGGHVGVQLFVVISGFILAVISYDKQLSIPRFYLSRSRSHLARTHQRSG